VGYIRRKSQDLDGRTDCFDVFLSFSESGYGSGNEDDSFWTCPGKRCREALWIAVSNCRMGVSRGRCCGMGCA
jgi:hypothetical protein